MKIIQQFRFFNEALRLLLPKQDFKDLKDKTEKISLNFSVSKETQDHPSDKIYNHNNATSVNEIEPVDLSLHNAADSTTQIN